MEDSTPLLKALKTQFADQILVTHHYRGQQTVVLRREVLVEAVTFLKKDAAMAFDILMDLTAVDYLKFGRAQKSSPMLNTPSPLPYYMTSKSEDETWQRGVSIDEFRFDVVYHFYSTKQNHRLRVKVPLSLSSPVIESVTSLWNSANWFEREVWDMYGIQFAGHPNLKRILMYEEFKGHPLRKDYPIRRRQPLIGPPT